MTTDAWVAVLYGRPRGRLAGGGVSSNSGLPSSKPESLSGRLCGIAVSFVVGTSTPAPLRILMRTLVWGSAVVESVVVWTMAAGVIVIGRTGMTVLKLLLLLEVPFFSAKVNGSSMIIQSEFDPSSFLSSRTLVMLETGTVASGIGWITGTATGGVLKSTEAGIALRAAVRLGRGSM